MKKVFTIVLAVVMLASMGGVALADKPPEDWDSLGNPIYGGNGAPSGPHFNLNLIGMKFDDMNKSCEEETDGHVIFVKLGTAGAEVAKKTKINLSTISDPEDPEYGTFKVIDCDGTDGTAEFRLPNPDPENTGTTEYSVYMRVLGSPKNNPSVMMETCAYDPLADEIVCSALNVVEVRTKGKKSFTNVSKELLYIYAYVCTEVEAGECVAWEFMRVPLFSDILKDYFWNYHNRGVKLAQLRFYYNVSTTVPDPEDVEPE